MIIDLGPRIWKNIHVTVKSKLEKLLRIDNTKRVKGSIDEKGESYQLDKLEALNQCINDVNELIDLAKENKKEFRAFGSAWALSDILHAKDWMLNTKQLNRCFEIEDKEFHPQFDKTKKPYVVIAQCGISIEELNDYLERPKDKNAEKRSLKTAGIGAGQTIAGAVFGNTHGSAINFGAIPDFVVGIQICTGNGRKYWIEKENYPVMSDHFIKSIGCHALRDNQTFNSAVISFGAFGVATALAIEVEPVYHITFKKAETLNLLDLKTKMENPSTYKDVHHFEFVFNPYDKKNTVTYLEGHKTAYKNNHPKPKQLWLYLTKHNFTFGDRMVRASLTFPLVPKRFLSKWQYKAYLKNSILDNVEGSPGQLYTATITYLEGYNETAFAVSILDAYKTILILIKMIRKEKHPLVIQARAVNPGETTLGFTNHEPKAVVFEYGILNDKRYVKFEDILLKELKDKGIKYTLHWSKNAGISNKRFRDMYGDHKINEWISARKKVFGNEKEYMRLFDNAHLRRAGIDFKKCF